MQRTITTFLIDGTLDGVQNIFDENGTCELYVIPRTRLDYINSDEQLALPALYILLGTDDKERNLAYIGETESFRERVKHHDKNKTFWSKALVFVSKYAVINKANVQYLEYLALKQAKTTDSFELHENKQTPKCPHLAKHHKAPIDSIFQEVKFITQFAGCNIFEPKKEMKLMKSVPISIQPSSSVEDMNLFYIKGRGADAQGYYLDHNRFTILKGSIIAKGATNSYQGCSSNKEREVFLKDYVKSENELLVLQQDFQAQSPSQAASFCVGSSINGWDSWKNEIGQSLAHVYRKTNDK